MDTFIDKLAQKRNAQEMIRANMSAEAEKMEQMQNQMKAYDELMQEIRQVNLKTAENVSEVQNALRECIGKLEEMQVKDKAERDAENAHKEAAEQERTAERAKAQEQVLLQLKELLEEKFRQSDDFLHKENVKVYRNVQAAVTEEMNKLTEEMNRQSEEIKNGLVENRASRAVLPISILILLGVIADILIQLFAFKIPM